MNDLVSCLELGNIFICVVLESLSNMFIKRIIVLRLMGGGAGLNSVTKSWHNHGVGILLPLGYFNVS